MTGKQKVSALDISIVLYSKPLEQFKGLLLSKEFLNLYGSHKRVQKV